MNKAFGLDIGASTIKVVWLDNKDKKFTLKSAGIFPSPPRGIISNSSLDWQELALSIQKAVGTARIETRNVNLALSENQVYTKVLEMPVLSDRELRSAIYWEAEQYIPVPLSDITLTWAVLDRPKNSSPTDKMLVLMVGAPTDLIQKYQTVLTTAGFTINSMETEILATVRSLISSPDFPPTIILNIGAVSASLAIIRNNIMVFTYSMAVGGFAINHAIATDFGFTQEQAEEYKRTYGLSDKTFGGKIGQATTPILDSMIAEIKKAMAFYSQKYKDFPIRQIILAGGTAKLPGIEVYFAKNTGIETVIADPWKIIASQELPKEILQNGADYAIAVGLAMRI